MSGNNNVITIGNLTYIKKCPECSTCEFIPSCRLCTWVSRSEMNNILDDDKGIIEDRAYHIKEKKRRIKKLYKKYKREKKMDVNEENVIVL